MHSDYLYCRDRRRRYGPISLLCAALVLVIAGTVAGLHIVDRKIESLRKSAAGFASRAELKSLRDEGLSLFGGLKAEIIEAVDIQVDAARKESHARRKALADEVRKEMARDANDRLAGDSWLKVQVDAERTRRRDETGELFDARDKTYNALLRHQDEITAIRKQLFAVEQAWLNHRCPTPAPIPAAPPKVTPPAIAPLSRVYTIPYPWFYERPRCR